MDLHCVIVLIFTLVNVVPVLAMFGLGMARRQSRFGGDS